MQKNRRLDFFYTYLRSDLIVQNSEVHPLVSLIERVKSIHKKGVILRTIDLVEITDNQYDIKLTSPILVLNGLRKTEDGYSFESDIEQLEFLVERILIKNNASRMERENILKSLRNI